MWDVKYRPLRFSDVLGQESSVKVLQSRLQKGTAFDTSYIFSGGWGQGKSTLARILARALLCSNRQDGEPCNQCSNCVDCLNETSAALVELDAASRGTVDNVRAIVDDLPFAVSGAAKRVYIVDECHRMSRDAQDVLLHPLEEKKLVGIFCTTEPEKIRGPVRSRCEEYALRRIPREAIFSRLKGILGKEGVVFEDDALLIVIDYSGGHVRDVLNRLEMLSQLGDVTVEAVRSYLRLSVTTVYYDILLSLGDPRQSVTLVEDLCADLDVKDVASGLAEAAMSAYRLAHKMHVDFTLVDRERAEKVYASYGDQILHLVDYFLNSARSTRIGLACDVIRLASGVSSQALQAPQAVPVVFQVPSGPYPKEGPSKAFQAEQVAVAEPSTPPVNPAPAEPVAPPVEPVAPPVEPVAPPAEPVAPPAEPVAPPAEPDPRFRDKGTLTEIEKKAMPKDLPRGAKRGSQKLATNPVKVRGTLSIIPPEQWRHEFEAALTHWTKRAP